MSRPNCGGCWVCWVDQAPRLVLHCMLPITARSHSFTACLQTFGTGLQADCTMMIGAPELGSAILPACLDTCGRVPVTVPGPGLGHHMRRLGFGHKFGDRKSTRLNSSH